MLGLDQHRHGRAFDDACAAVRVARDAGSRATQARALAVLARVLAQRGDIAACRRSLDDAHDVLSAIGQDAELEWVAFFTLDQWAAESVYALASSAHPSEIEELARAALTSTSRMRRRQLLLTATLASSYCRPVPGGSHVKAGRELEHATDLVIDAVRAPGTIGSARVLALIDDVRSVVRSAGPPALGKSLDDAVRLTLRA